MIGADSHPARGPDTPFDGNTTSVSLKGAGPDGVQVTRVVNAGTGLAIAAVVCQSALYLWSSFVLDRPLYDIGTAATFNSVSGAASIGLAALMAALLALLVPSVRPQALAHVVQLLAQIEAVVLGKE